MDTFSEQGLDKALFQNREIIYLLENEQCALELNEDQSKIIISAVSTNEILVEILTSDLIGVKCKYDEETPTGDPVLTLYSYPYQSINPDAALRERRVIDLQFSASENMLPYWHSTLTALISSPNCARETKGSTSVKDDDSKFPHLVEPRRRFLVMMNPKSGNGSTTLNAWHDTVQVMLEEAGILYDIYTTEYPNHAKELMYHCSTLSEYSTILIMGGDGIVNEVINGIGLRDDKESIFQTVLLAPIPCGSGNGIIKSILYECAEGMSITNATFLAIRGERTPGDLSLLQPITDKPTDPILEAPRYLSLSMMWGLVADVDIFSEALRWLGELRFFLAGFYYIYQKRIYTGTLRMKLNPTCTYESSVLRNKTVTASTTPLPADVVPDPKKKDWVCLEGSFVMVAVLQTSHITTTTHFGPEIKLADGVFTVYVIDSTVSRYDLLQCLLSVDTADHIYQMNVVRMFQCLEYELIPSSSVENVASFFSVDGEVMPCQPIRGTMLPGAVQYCQVNNKKMK